MRTQDCQHVGCSRQSRTGYWCQSCIEREWPYAALGDGNHWIVWKGVDRVRKDLFQGALGCPYQLAQLAFPGVSVSEPGQRIFRLIFGESESTFRSEVCDSYWFLSPLGAIKAGYGTHILAALVCSQGCLLTSGLVLYSLSPVLPLAAFPRSRLPDRTQATAWLADVNTHLEEIEVFERKMRNRLRRRLKNIAEPLMALDRVAECSLELWELVKELWYSLREEFQKDLDQLDERERKVLELLYGLEDGHPRTLKNVARVFNITCEQVRQIENEAIQKLKHPKREE